MNNLAQNLSIYNQEPVSSSRLMATTNDNNSDDLVKNTNYAYLIAKYLNQCGIEPCTKVLKAIAEVQEILDHIITDLSQIKALMEQIQGMGWGDVLTPIYDPKDKTKIIGYVDSGTKYDPSNYTDAQNQAQMQRLLGGWDEIKDGKTIHHPGWLEQTSKNPFNGNKDCSNLQLMQAYWKDLFEAPDANHNEGLYYQLQDALNNPDLPPGSNSSIQALKDLTDPNVFKGASDNWKYNGKSFLDVLNGNVTDPATAANIMKKAYCDSWYNRTNQKPTDGKDTTYTDDVYQVTNEFEETKQQLNGLNTTESASLSMYSQNLTSYNQIGQQMIQTEGQETKAMVNNDKA